MRLEDIDQQLIGVSFDFFYWFSRFEFVLKENSFLKNDTVGSTAEASWEKFREHFKTDYNKTKDADKLIKLHPRRQVVAGNETLSWRPVGVEHCNNDLCKVIAMLLTIRNNLFHGGKHGDAETDNIERNIELLKTGKIVIDQLASQFLFENDYTRYY